MYIPLGRCTSPRLRPHSADQDAFFESTRGQKALGCGIADADQQTDDQPLPASWTGVASPGFRAARGETHV